MPLPRLRAADVNIKLRPIPRGLALIMGFFGRGGRALSPPPSAAVARGDGAEAVVGGEDLGDLPESAAT